MDAMPIFTLCKHRLLAKFFPALKHSLENKFAQCVLDIN